jgi:hypothetical protein
MKITLTQILILALCICAVALVYAYKRIEAADQAKLYESKIITQNLHAQNDQATEVFAQVNAVSSQVQNLNATNEDLKQKNTAINVAYSGLQADIADIIANGTGVAKTDSTEHFDEVDISAFHQGIATLSGWTKYYTSPLGKSPAYQLNVKFDSIEISSWLSYDPDGIFRIHDSSLTAGVLIKSSSKIDSLFYVGLLQTVQHKQESVKAGEPSFGLKAFVGVGTKLGVTSSAITTGSSLFLDDRAALFYQHWNLIYYPTASAVSFGWEQTIDVGHILTNIF